MTDHQADITGLAPGEHYHFKVTCIDPAGNISNRADMMHTDLEAVLSTGPGAGDVYRETLLAIHFGDDWRVTDPDALNSGAADFLPNPVLSLEVPDLTGAVRAEMIIDRWGGHPGTSNKRIRLAGRSLAAPARTGVDPGFESRVLHVRGQPEPRHPAGSAGKPGRSPSRARRTIRSATASTGASGVGTAW